MAKRQTRKSKTWGYVFERWDGEHPLYPGKKWLKRAIRIVAERVGRRLNPKVEEVHHKNRKRDDDRPRNLVLMGKAAHKSLHSKGRKFSRATRAKMSKAALALVTPAERQRRSRRAKAQHVQGRFGDYSAHVGPPRQMTKALAHRIKCDIGTQISLGKKYGVSPTVVFKVRSGYYDRKGWR